MKISIIHGGIRGSISTTVILDTSKDYGYTVESIRAKVTEEVRRKNGFVPLNKVVEEVSNTGKKDEILVFVSGTFFESISQQPLSSHVPVRYHGD